MPLNAQAQPIFAVIDGFSSLKIFHNDPQFVRDLLETFYDDAFHTSFPTLQESWEQHDWESLRAEIHRGKAVFPYIKVPELQQAMTDLQSLLQEDSPSQQQIDTLFSQVREQLRRALSETRVFLS